ncbi:MAG: hypothetical protein ACPLYF_04860 [Fervidobacterium sp.]
MKISIILVGTVDDWLDLEKFLNDRKIEYSSIMSKCYRNLLAVVWMMHRLKEGKLIDQTLEQVMENIDTVLNESEELKNHIQNTYIVIDADLPTYEVLPLYNWYTTRKRTREKEYEADLSEKLKRTIKKLVGLAYSELGPFQVSVIGDGTYVTLIWDILIKSELTDEERNQLLNIAAKRYLTVEESLLVLKCTNKNKFHVWQT